MHWLFIDPLAAALGLCVLCALDVEQPTKTPKTSEPEVKEVRPKPPVPKSPRSTEDLKNIGSKQAPPKPGKMADLEIKEARVSGNTAKVLVGNKGYLDAGPCRLRMEILQHSKTGKVPVDKVIVNVPALEASKTVWVTIHSPVSLQIAGRELRFEVNVTRVVRESDYKNNVKVLVFTEKKS